MATLDLSLGDDILEKFQDLKMKNKYRFIVFHLTNNYKKIEVEHVLERTSAEDCEKDFEKLKPLLPAKDCRFVVYKTEFSMGSNSGLGEGQREKIAFVAWSPIDASVKSRLMYTSAKQNFKKKLVGLGADVQMTPSECEYKSILEKCMQFTR